MYEPLPPEALERAQTSVETLRTQLQILFESIEPGSNSAIRFEAGERP